MSHYDSNEYSFDVDISREVAYCFKSSWAAGWWAPPAWLADRVSAEEWLQLITPTKLALIHSEISEALEGFRKNVSDKHLPDRSAFEVELADAVMRIFDLAGAHNIDLGAVIGEKLHYNKSRPDHKPEARGSEGGKRF